MFYIRADGNTNIGMGHVMRCLSIAEASAENDKLGKPIFITADSGCKEMITGRGFEVIILDTDFKDMMSEIPLLEKIFDKEKDILLVDSYQVSDMYFHVLKKLVKTACLEDMGFSHPVDLLINYNIYAPNLAQNYINNKETLLGVSYMPLRKQFQQPSDYAVKDRVTDVVITTGGSDPYFASSAIMDAVLENSVLSEADIHWHILSGPFNKFKEQLLEKYVSFTNITIHENVQDMRGLLLKMDAVVTATGSTIYEVSSLGIPMIVFYFAENQKQGAETLEQITDIVNAGCFAENSGQVTERIVDALIKCVQNKEYRTVLFAQEKELVDGKGAGRIAQRLSDYLQ